MVSLYITVMRICPAKKNDLSPESSLDDAPSNGGAFSVDVFRGADQFAAMAFLP